MRFWRESVQPRLPLLAAVLLSLAATGLAFQYAYLLRAYTELTPDEGNYLATARRLLSDHVFSFWGSGPDAYVSPGYPMFLAACFAVFGSGERGVAAVRVLQCLLSGGTVVLTFLLGRALTKRNAAGLIAAALVCCNCGFSIYPRMLLTESLYFFLMPLSFLLFAQAEEKDAPVRFAAAGLAFGAAVMVRSLVVSALPFLLLPRLLRRRRDRSCSLRPVWLFLAGFLLPCLPWWIRNLVTLHRLVLWATQTNPFYAGLAPDVAAAGLEDPGTYLGNFRLLFRLLAQDPVGTLSWMSLGKFRIIFMSADWAPHQAVSDLARNLTVCLGLSGAVLALASRRTRLRSLPFWAYFLCIFFSVPVSRYAYQYLLLLAIFAGWLLVAAWERIRRRNEV